MCVCSTNTKDQFYHDMIIRRLLSTIDGIRLHTGGMVCTANIMRRIKDIKEERKDIHYKDVEEDEILLKMSPLLIGHNFMEIFTNGLEEYKKQHREPKEIAEINPQIIEETNLCLKKTSKEEFAISRSIKSNESTIDIILKYLSAYGKSDDEVSHDSSNNNQYSLSINKCSSKELVPYVDTTSNTTRVISKYISTNPNRLKIQMSKIGEDLNMISKTEKNEENCNKLCRVERDTSEYGGYLKNILTENFTERDKILLTCPRCDGVLREPRLLSSGEQFCLCCMERDEQGNPNLQVNRMVSSLKCSCPLFKRGCEWLGKLGDCENHLNNCIYVLQECKMGCGAVLPRGKHSAHVNECPMMKVTCELGCGKAMCREDISHHLQHECEEMEVICPFTKYNCVIGVMKRRDLKIHLNEKRLEHIESKLVVMEDIVVKQNEIIKYLIQDDVKQYDLIEKVLYKSRHPV